MFHNLLKINMKSLNTIFALLLSLSVIAFASDKPEEIQYTQYYDVLPNVSTCTPGVLKQSVIDEVIAIVNEIRDLHRLEPLTYDIPSQGMSMEGCLNMVASGQGGHIDDPSTPCYTPAAGQARMKSNIEYGSGSSTPIGSIIGWMIDDKNADVEGEYKVGHRRAFLNPFLKKFSFGRADGVPVGGGFFSASNFLYQDFTYGDAASTELDFMAYPFEYYPPDYVNKSFYLSFNVLFNKNDLWANQNVSFASTTVEMTNENGNSLNVHSIRNDNEGWGSFPNNLSWKADGLVDEVRYNVKINNVIVNGSPKSYTYWFQLTNINHTQPPATPTLLIPANLAKSVSISGAFSWKRTQNTKNYHLQVSQDESFTKIIVNEKNLTSNGFVAPGLDYESTYWWRVASSNDAGVSPWSAPFSFSTTTPTPDKPYLAGPANNSVLNTTTPKLFWTAVPGAETYSVQISRDDTFQGFSVRYTKSFLTDTFDIVPAARLSNETDYWWRVKSVNAGGESSYTPSWKFNTGVPLPAPSLVGPANNSETTLTPTLSWNVVPGAASYNVQISERVGFDQGLNVNELRWEDVNYTVPSGILKDGKTYYWRVKANSESGFGPFSEVMSFVAKGGASVHNLSLSNLLTIYPNPVRESFFVKIDSESALIDLVIVRDAIGNEVKRISADSFSGMNIDVMNNAPGIYFITVLSGNQAYTGKFSIVR